MREGVLRSLTLHPDGTRRDAIVYARLPQDPDGASYDAGDLAECYRAHVAPGPASANFVMEEPALLAALGEVRGLRVVDLGCGDAALGRRLLESGAASYLGIDASEQMIAAARAMLQGTRGELRRQSIEDFAAPPGSADLIVSRMALHYVANLDGVLRACHDCLSAGGRIVLSVTHPVVTSHDARASGDAPRGNWVVDDYFTPGPREHR